MCIRSHRRLASLLAGASALAAGAAAAQTSAGQVPAALEEVVVTATRRATNLQTTPVAVSAYDAEALEARNVEDLRDLALSTPGFVVSGSAGFDFPTSIRGVSSAASGIGADLPVAVYVDGVYLPRGNSAVFGLVNVAQVEVLKGPQGTLFGRNATAGAILIATRPPPGAFEAYGDILYGRFDERRVRLSVGGPLGAGWRASVSAAMRRRDGFQTNQFDGSEVNGEASDDVRIALRFDDGGPLDATLRLDAGRFESPIFNKGIQADPFYTAPISLDVIDRVVRNIDRVSNNHRSFSEREEWGAGLTLGYELGPQWRLKAISAYRQGRVEFQVDTDGSAASLLRSNQRWEKQHQLSQELQLARGGERLDLILGAYLFREEARTLFFADSYVGNLRQGFSAHNVTRSAALFAEARWRATDRLAATAGVRLSREEKDFSNVFQVAAGQPTDPSKARPDAIAFTKARTSSSRDWDDVSPRFVLDYRVTDRVFAYASASRGFKSGGHNFTSDTDPPFGPEKVWSYELGVKSEWFERRLRLNAAAYRQDYKDLQVRLPSGPGVAFFTNASGADIRGLELEAVAQPTPLWRLEASASFMKATYEDYVSFAANAQACLGGRFDPGSLTCDLSGNDLNRAPRRSVYVAVQRTFPLEAGEVVARASYARNSRAFYNDRNTLGNSGWERLDASLAWRSPDEQVTVELWGKNLTDDRYFTFINTVGPAFIGTPNVPATWGVTLSFKH